jgi:hypothetical protein
MLSEERRIEAMMHLEAAREGKVVHRCIKCNTWMKVRFEDFATLGREVAGKCRLCKSSEQEESEA